MPPVRWARPRCTPARTRATSTSAKALLARGAKVDAGDNWRGQTPLMWAAAQGHAAMVRVLVEAGADVNTRSTVVTWERQRTAEPRDKWLPPGGFTALLLAARAGCVDCVNVLAKSGADINEIDPENHTALVLALMNGEFDVAGALIDAGIDVNVADNVGRTALYAAVDAHTMPSSNRPAPKEADSTLSSMDIIQKLLAKGANINAALRAALPYRTKLDRGGDGVLGAGTTPLLRAAKAGDTPVIKLLLEKGANAKAATRNGVNAIMMAANVATREEDMTGRNKTQKDAIETITLLLAAGTDINGADNQGRTAAHGAALWGLTDVVTFLHEERRQHQCAGQARLPAARLRAWAGWRLRLRRQRLGGARRDRQGDRRSRRHSGHADSRCASRPPRRPQRRTTRRTAIAIRALLIGDL